MAINRRRFLKYTALTTGLGAAGGAYWLATSKRRAARWLRTIIADSRRTITPAPVKPQPTKWSNNQVTVCWVGHATVLINFYGINILTDPALGSRIGVSVGLGTAGPKRYIAAALRPRELPRIDLLLLSHGHMDHMDLPTLGWFPKSTPTITAKQTSDILAGTGLKQISELAWNDRKRITTSSGDVEIEAVQVKHWGKRWPSEKIDRGYNGYILRREGRSILFGGDTANTPLFSALHSKGPFDVAIMPIAAYNPWIRSHCTPEEAFQMADAAGASHIVPIHHQTFKLSDEPMNEPIQRLQKTADREIERIALKQVGETFVFS